MTQPLADDPTAAIEFHRPDDRFVPIRASDILRTLAGDEERFGPVAAAAAEVAEALQHVIDQETDSFERYLCDLYAAFNPDRDTKPIADLTESRAGIAYDEVRQQLEYLLDKANFHRLTDVQIDAAVHAATNYGLRVRLHPEQVESLAVFVRGRGTIERRRRSWRAPIKGCMVTIPVYRRLAVVFQLTHQPYVNLKMFKEIPVEDVQALLPHAEAQMRLLDRVMVFGGGAGAIGTTAAKIVQIATTALAITKLAWILLTGFVALVFKTFMGYRRARANNDSQRTRHLYFQNLANNAGVIHSLTTMIGQEEMKEAIIAYTFLAARGKDGRRLRSRDELREQLQAWMKERFEVDVSFDLEDALETLTRFDLWQNADILEVVPPAEAIRRLEAHCAARRSRDYHRGRALQGDGRIG